MPQEIQFRDVTFVLGNFKFCRHFVDLPEAMV